MSVVRYGCTVRVYDGRFTDGVYGQALRTRSGRFGSGCTGVRFVQSDSCTVRYGTVVTGHDRLQVRGYGRQYGRQHVVVVGSRHTGQSVSVVRYRFDGSVHSTVQRVRRMTQSMSDVSQVVQFRTVSRQVTACKRGFQVMIARASASKRASAQGVSSV